MCTQYEAIALFREAVEKTSSVTNQVIVDAYLYGSYARGDFHDESDIDILFTVNVGENELSKMRKEVASIASSLSLKSDVTVSIMIANAEQFLNYSNIMPFYSNVLKEGIKYAG